VPQPRVTVAVPTARRPAALQRLLDALPAAIAGGPDAELLVVDNDRNGSARDVVEGAGLKVRYVVEPEPGSAFARNRAIAETATPVLALLDDDVVPRPGWLDEVTRPVLAGAAGCGGRVVLDPSVPRPRWFDESGIGGYVTSFDLEGPARALGHDEYIVTANAAFDVGALRAVGGFDPALGPRPGSQLVADDVHVVRMLQRAGGEVWWAPSAVVVHDLPAERLRPRWLLRRAYLQGRSDWLLDAEELRARRGGGARVALSWLGHELQARRREGLRDPATRFHLATDVSRTLGALRQALGLRREDPDSRR
jgi:GT2 family glycosyltransferase